MDGHLATFVKRIMYTETVILDDGSVTERLLCSCRNETEKRMIGTGKKFLSQKEIDSHWTCHGCVVFPENQSELSPSSSYDSFNVVVAKLRRRRKQNEKKAGECVS